MTYRVIHWATGHTGKMVVRATAERPDYQIVGGFTYSPDKAGRDLGEVCETRNLGVALTNGRAAIHALEADCVLFLAGAEVDPPASVKDICALLASGKNVVTTAAQFIYPRSMGPEVESAIAAACVKGGTTFHGLGVMPGFFSESVPLLLSRLSRRVDKIVAYETLMYDKYPSAYQMFELMGFGYAPDDTTPVFSNVELVGETWRHSAILLADALDLKIDRVENFRETAVTPRDLHVAAGTIKAGTVGAMAFGVRLVCDGEVRAVLQHYTRMAEELAPEWPSGDGWTIELQGEPSIKAKIEIGTEGSIMPTDDACMATAMHAIHAVPYVIDAQPGILSLADVPPAWGKDAFHIGRPGAARGR
jgi:2,4-diaminopentanoate dehydrogenase